MSHIIISTSPTHSGKAEQMLEGTGCTEIYETFELCLADNDRSFKICKDSMMKVCLNLFLDPNTAAIDTY
jgi:hypothetical protein